MTNRADAPSETQMAVAARAIGWAGDDPDRARVFFNLAMHVTEPKARLLLGPGFLRCGWDIPGGKNWLKAAEKEHTVLSYVHHAQDLVGFGQVMPGVKWMGDVVQELLWAASGRVLKNPDHGKKARQLWYDQVNDILTSLEHHVKREQWTPRRQVIQP